MKKHDESLFKIGEITKILGITRKTVLVYEEMGLLTPAVKDENSGYRYYTADNMTQIRSIRSLQSLGLSLTEIREYYYDTANIDHHLKRLMDLRAALDRNIQLLQVRAAKPGDLSVHPIQLSKQVCFAADINVKILRTHLKNCVTPILQPPEPARCPCWPECLRSVSVSLIPAWIFCAVFR